MLIIFPYINRYLTFVLYLGIKLGLRHITICSAAVYFHKFYNHVDKTAYDNYVSVIFYQFKNLTFYFIYTNYNTP